MRSWPAENLARCHVWGGSNKNCRCHMSPIKTKECVFKTTCDPTIPLCLAKFELVVLSLFFFRRSNAGNADDSVLVFNP